MTPPSENAMSAEIDTPVPDYTEGQFRPPLAGAGISLLEYLRPQEDAADGQLRPRLPVPDRGRGVSASGPLRVPDRGADLGAERPGPGQ